MKNNLKKIWTILDLNQKKQFYTLIFLILLGMFFELLSIGLVFPVVSILFDVGNESSVYMRKIFSFLNSEISREKMVVFSLISLILVYFIKNLVLTLIAKIEVSKVIKIKFQIAEKLYKKFINFPYKFHSNTNSSILINYVIDQIDSFSNSLFNCVILTAEILILVGVILTLFIIEPSGTLIIAIFSTIFAYLFYSVMKKRISKLSEERSFNNSLKIKNLQETFGSIKEIKIYNKENYFLNLFNYFNRKVVNIEGYETFLKRLPRLWFEFLCVLIFVTFLIFIFLFSKIDLISLTPILGIFGVATIRIIPSVNRILLAIQTINFGEAAIKMISDNFNVSDSKNNYTKIMDLGKFNFSKNLNFENVDFKFNNDTQIFNKINFNIQKGDFVGVFGETGVGKSTLLNLLLGLIKPSGGEIKVDNYDIHKNLRGWQLKIGFVPQNIYLLDDSISKNIAFGFDGNKIDKERLENTIKEAQLEKFVQSLPDKENTFVGERGMQVSGGQLQRIGIARAIYSNPEVLIFDESTSSLDNETELKIMETIKSIKKDKTIIFVSHKKTPMKFCNKIFELKKNKIFENTNL